MENRLRLGQFVTQRQGATFVENWVDGSTFNDIMKQQEIMNHAKEELDKERKLLQKKRPQLEKETTTKSTKEAKLTSSKCKQLPELTKPIVLGHFFLSLVRSNNCSLSLHLRSALNSNAQNSANMPTSSSPTMLGSSNNPSQAGGAVNSSGALVSSSNNQIVTTSTSSSVAAAIAANTAAATAAANNVVSSSNQTNSQSNNDSDTFLKPFSQSYVNFSLSHPHFI